MVMLQGATTHLHVMIRKEIFRGISNLLPMTTGNIKYIPGKLNISLVRT